MAENTVSEEAERLLKLTPELCFVFYKIDHILM